MCMQIFTGLSSQRHMLSPLCVCVCMCMYVCVCERVRENVCVCERERESERGKKRESVCVRGSGDISRVQCISAAHKHSFRVVVWAARALLHSECMILCALL